MRAKSHPNCRVLPPCRRPLEWGHKGKMAADPAHKMVPPRWLCRFKDKGKMVWALFHKMVLPSWPHGLGNKWNKDGRQEEPLREGKSLHSSSDCRWRLAQVRVASTLPATFSCHLWDVTSVGARSSLLQVNVGGNGFFGTHMGWACPQAQLKLCRWWDLGFAKFVLETVSNCEMQLFRVAIVAKPTPDGACTLGRCCQEEEQVALGAPVL